MEKEIDCDLVGLGGRLDRRFGKSNSLIVFEAPSTHLVSHQAFTFTMYMHDPLSNYCPEGIKAAPRYKRVMVFTRVVFTLCLHSWEFHPGSCEW